MLGSIYKTVANRQEDNRRIPFPALLAGYAGMNAIPAAQKQLQNRVDTEYGNYEQAILGQYTPPIEPDAPMVTKEHLLPLLLGEIISRSTGGQGVVEPFLQGRGYALGQQRQTRQEQQQAQMQKNALAAEIQRMRLGKAQNEAERFDTMLDRGQRNVLAREKMQYEQEQAERELQLKLASMGQTQANIENDNLQARANGFNNNIAARWNAGGQFSPQELDNLNRQRLELIASGVPEYTLQPIPAGPTLAKQREVEDNRQWKMEFDKDVRQFNETNARLKKSLALDIEKFEWSKKKDGEITPEERKKKQKWFQDIDKAIEETRLDYVTADSMASTAPDDDMPKAQQHVTSVIAKFRYLLRKKHEALGVKQKRPNYYETILPDGTFEDRSGIQGAADVMTGTISGAIGKGNRPTSPPPPPKTKGSGTLRQVAPDVWKYDAKP